jgi:hypothetical protein
VFAPAYPGGLIAPLQPLMPPLACSAILIHI